MAVDTVTSWRDVRAEMARADVSIAALAEALGYSYPKIAHLLASETDSTPTPEFVTRVLAAIEKAAKGA